MNAVRQRHINFPKEWFARTKNLKNFSASRDALTEVEDFMDRIYDSSEDAVLALELQGKQGQVLKFRNASKDLKEEILSGEEYDSLEDAMLVKEKTEVDTEEMKITVQIHPREIIRKETKNVRMLFLTEENRISYLEELKKEGYLFSEISFCEEQRVEEFSFDSCYETYEEARNTLSLLEEHYHTLGQIVLVDTHQYQVLLNASKTMDEVMYVLEAVVSSYLKRTIYELEIENIKKGYDYRIRYLPNLKEAKS